MKCNDLFSLQPDSPVGQKPQKGHVPTLENHRRVPAVCSHSELRYESIIITTAKAYTISLPVECDSRKDDKINGLRICGGYGKIVP